jgi:hypothetical protein
MKYLVLLAVAGVVLSGVDAESDPDAIACYVDGVKYEVRDTVPSDDPCERWCVILLFSNLKVYWRVI